MEASNALMDLTERLPLSENIGLDLEVDDVRFVSVRWARPAPESSSSKSLKVDAPSFEPLVDAAVWPPTNILLTVPIFC